MNFATIAMQRISSFILQKQPPPLLEALEVK